MASFSLRISRAILLCGEDHMEAVKVFERKDVPLDWEYDDEADTLYLSFGKPKAALGLDIGEGVVVRYDE